MNGPPLFVGVLLVAVGGAAGALLRHLVDQAVARRTAGDYPWGILLVNLAGSLLLGLLTPFARAGVLTPEWMLLLGVGLCGALTTYSTVAAQTWGFVEQGRRGRAFVVIAATVLVSVGAAGLGLCVSSVLT